MASETIIPNTESDSESRRDTLVSIKDFAYTEDDPLHYGVSSELRLEFEYNDYNESDEELPPWRVDEDDDGGEEDTLRRAVALYPFTPENENELALETEQIVLINYKYGDGWLVASDLETGETGLVPEEYVQLLEEDEARPFLPSILQDHNSDDEWEDEDDDTNNTDDDLSEVQQDIKSMKLDV